jgi:VTC domain
MSEARLEFEARFDVPEKRLGRGNSPLHRNRNSMHSERQPRDGARSTNERVSEAVVASSEFARNSRESVIDCSQSPSLRPWTPGEAPAYEMKFLLSETLARDVEARLAPSLTIDPHANSELDRSYLITTVYCETPELDVLNGRGIHQRRKYRLRRYDDSNMVYLERKIKRGERVRKNRSVVAADELTRLAGFETASEWPGDWFHRQLIRRRLSPVCCVSYLRRAWIGAVESGPVRLTFDRAIRGVALHEWLPRVTEPSRLLLEDQVVCEFKFRGSLPALFKATIHDLQLVPRGVSKFRHCLRALGIGHSSEVVDA